MAVRKIGVLSDIHCGSIYGLLPPNFTTSEGIPKPQNVGQKYLWECWIDFTDRLKEFKPEAIILNGDLIDGAQQAQRGSELSLPLLYDQEQAAIECLQVIKKKCPHARLFATQGTAYHVGTASQNEEHVAQILGCEKYPSIGTGVYVREVLWMDVDGIMIEAAHHISCASGFYRLTPLDREMQWSAMSAKDATKGIPKVDLLIRSHVHNFISGEHASKQGVVTPCWQLQTKYMRKNSTSRMIPDIGGIMVEVDANAKKQGHAPCNIIKELYPLPAVEVVKL